jgi:putative ABC transport system ATP-binding protein
LSYISVEHISKTYITGNVKTKAVENVSFKIEKGEIAAIVGSSGAGKTTVLNILGGMDNLDEGSIYIDNSDISSFNQKELTKYRRQDIGFVFQFYNLVQNLTAKENIELAIQKCPNAIRPETILREVGLGDRLSHFPAQLSGGEQQRVSIARALAKRPKLLLCDEPTGALDYETGKSILKLLQNIAIKTHMTVIIITHNLAITPMANRVIKMKNGKIEEIKVNENPASIQDIEW